MTLLKSFLGATATLALTAAAAWAEPAVLFDLGGKFDKSFNESSFNGATRWATETGRARLDEIFADHERAFLPLDLPWAVMAFLRRAKPRMVVLLELEVWPVLLLCCH